MALPGGGRPGAARRAVRDTGVIKGWAEAARAAEERGAWDEAISLVSAFADCETLDYRVRDAHLWHMQLLAKAGRLDVLARLAETCKHAQRQLNRHLRENGQADELHRRAQDGDTDALLKLARLLRDQGRKAKARRTVLEIDGTNAYALQLADELLDGE